MSEQQERQRAALRREGMAYLSSGRLDRVELVNEQLRKIGGEPIEVPSSKPAQRQTRSSAQAATRRKRADSDG